MPVTTTTIKDLFALVGKSVTPKQMAQLRQAFQKQAGSKSTTEDDLVMWLYRQARDLANRHTQEDARSKAEAVAADLWT